MSHRGKGKLILIFLVMILLAGVGIFLFLWEDSDSNVDVGDYQSQSGLGEIEYQGHTYEYNNRLFNILFLGIDNDEPVRAQDIPGQAGQTDTIMLLTLNRENGQAQILQIPRDTITEIDVYDGNGNRIGSKTSHLALQYAYGIGGESSCWASKKTVSELLYELPIDGYFALDIASIAPLNDALGGVTLTMEKDYTVIDSEFKEGATLTLTGNQARRYIRYRDTDESFSNQDRMDRQLHYLPALIDTMKVYAGEEEEYIDKLLPLVEDYLVTDLTEGHLTDLADFTLAEADMSYLPGDWASGEEHDEFHVNDEELQKYLIETFYILSE